MNDNVNAETKHSDHKNTEHQQTEKKQIENNMAKDNLKGESACTEQAQPGADNNNLYDAPHRRYNPLTNEWLLVSPHRAKRPWQGQAEPDTAPNLPSYDEKCYLCPGNKRTSGATNPNYQDTFVFTNDFQALLPDTPQAVSTGPEFIRAESVQGHCRVICFSPRHDLTFARMSHTEIKQVVQMWVDQYAELSQQYAWVQIFENRGEAMGCSSPHPHGQIWSINAIPEIARKEQAAQRDYYARHGTPLLLDYVNYELKTQERIVCENGSWAVVVPYWAAWPFETIVLPRRAVARLTDLTDAERDDLADIIGRLSVRYDNLFQTNFPYSMGWHNCPGTVPSATTNGISGADLSAASDALDLAAWQFHAHYYPPLLRSATVRKFMVGFELLAEPQRDLTPEQAAARLKDLSEVHYTQATPT